MKQEIKEKWVAALRSGEYIQGKEMLKDGDKFCCLGVLCDLYSKEKNVPWNENKGLNGNQPFLPDNVKKWCEIKRSSLTVNYQGYSHHLVGLNDDLELPFTEIADLIEKQL